MATTPQSPSNPYAAESEPTDLMRDVGDQVRQAGEDTAKRAGRLATEAKDKALNAAEGGRDRLADKLDDLAAAVERSGRELEGHQDWLAGLVERGAEELGDLASTVRSNDLRGLLGKLEEVARRQPVLFVGAAMAAGFASARLGKTAISSATEARDGRK